jgi:hypothetical protein
MKKSEETRQKMRRAHLGKKQSEETKEKIRAAMLIYWQDVKLGNAMLHAVGLAPAVRRHSPETIAKMKRAAKGRKLSPQARAALLAYQQERRYNAKIKNEYDQSKKGI